MQEMRIKMTKLSEWERQFYDEKIRFVLGDFKSQEGIFKGCTCYTRRHELVWEIYIPFERESREYTCEYFKFVDVEKQRMQDKGWS